VIVEALSKSLTALHGAADMKHSITLVADDIDTVPARRIHPFAYCREVVSLRTFKPLEP